MVFNKSYYCTLLAAASLEDRSREIRDWCSSRLPHEMALKVPPIGSYFHATPTLGVKGYARAQMVEGYADLYMISFLDFD